MSWASWLQGRLDDRNWKGADLVRESQGAIKRDRVSKWLRGQEAPSHRLAVVTANTLGEDSADALEAAGFGIVRLDARGQVKLDPDKTISLIRSMERGLPRRLLLARLQEYTDAELLAELQRRASGQSNVVHGDFGVRAGEKDGGGAPQWSEGTAAHDNEDWQAEQEDENE